MRRLPGDLSEKDEVKQMIRVNHAGEFGAIRIYQGQLAIMRSSPEKNLVKEMLKGEQVHFDEFNTMIKSRKIRPTALMPIWNIAGFALGAATALMGKKAAFACTIAVESVIEKHYAEQKDRLSLDEKELAQTISKFRDEELEHHDTSIKNGGKETIAFPYIDKLVQKGSKLAIWLSNRL
jgi:3-demethoxyubiquinol 3-hydroxylase